MTSTEQELLEEIVQGKSKDLFTGLLNRKFVLLSLEQAITKTRVAKASSICVAWLDVDGMKFFNDGMGHQISDSALLAIARTLEK